LYVHHGTCIQVLILFTNVDIDIGDILILLVNCENSLLNFDHWDGIAGISNCCLSYTFIVAFRQRFVNKNNNGRYGNLHKKDKISWHE
jgi:hypothetical protein